MFNLVKKVVKVAVGIYAVIVGVGVVIGIHRVNKEFEQARLSTGGRRQVVVHGVEVIHDTHGLRMLGIRVAGACRSLLGTYHIVVDDSFFTFDDVVQQGILAHEQGHLALGHIENLKENNIAERTRISRMGGVQDIELEADAYAVGIVGKANYLRTLNALLTLPGCDRKEIQARIRAIQ